MNRHQRSDATSHASSAERGAALVEYVLLLSLIVLVALASVSAFGSTVNNSVDDSASRVVAASGG